MIVISHYGLNRANCMVNKEVWAFIEESWLVNKRPDLQVSEE